MLTDAPWSPIGVDYSALKHDKFESMCWGRVQLSRLPEGYCRKTQVTYMELLIVRVFILLRGRVHSHLPLHQTFGKRNSSAYRLLEVH